MGTDFAERLKELRKRKGLTQTQLADALGVHLQTVSKWERGVTEPDISLIGETAAALGATVEELAGAPVPEETFTGTFSAVGMGRCIAALRKVKGESQEALAGVFGASGDTVSKWERGIACPGIDALAALAEHFEVPVSRIYFGIEPEERVIALPQAKKRRRRSFTFIAACALLCVTAILLAVLLPPALSVDKTVFAVTADGVVYDVGEGEWFSPAEPSRNGYDFLGWTDENGVYQPIPLQITSDIEIFPTYRPKEYAIDLWLNGGRVSGDVPQSFTVESGSVTLPVPDKAGTEFEGWYLSADYSGEPVTAVLCACADIVLYAKWSDIVYTVKYVMNGGVMSVSNPSEVTAGESVGLASPSRAGYVFLGWYDAPSGGERVERVGGENARNLTLYALWQRSDAQSKVTYVLGGGVPVAENPAVIGVGETAVLHEARREGYTFVGWYTSADGRGEPVTSLSGGEGDITLYAVWKPNEYTVIYETDGGHYRDGESNPNRVLYGETVTLAPLEKYGHTFAGWWATPDFSGEEVTVIDKENITGITRLYAKFVPDMFTVTLNAGDGTFQADGEAFSEHSFEVAYGETFTPPRPSLDGFEFLRWVDENGDAVSVVDRSNIRDGMTLTAVYKSLAPVEYFIVYDLMCEDFTDKGGNPDRANDRESVPLNDPVRPGYRFLGWNDRADGTGQFYAATPLGRTEQLTLYAIWQKETTSGSAEDLTYEKSETYVIVTGYTGETGENVDIVIPSEIEGKPVTGVQGLLFAQYGTDAITVRSVTLPETVETIGRRTLYNVNVTGAFTVPASVHTVTSDAFMYADVGELRFEEGSKLETIGEGAFEYVRVLGAPVLLPEGVKRIERYAMPLTHVGIVLPDGLEVIESGAFWTDMLFRFEILLPSSVKTVEKGAFCDNYTVSTSLSENEVSFAANCVEDGYVNFGLALSDVVLENDGEVTRLTGGQYVLPAPERPGYAFMGWQDEDGKFVPRVFIPRRGGAEVRLTAVWEQTTSGEGVTLVLEEGEEYTFIVAPSVYPESVTELILSAPIGARVRMDTEVTLARDLMSVEFDIALTWGNVVKPSFYFSDDEGGYSSSSMGAVYDGRVLSGERTATLCYFRVTVSFEIL